MRIIETKAYQYDELSDKAKEKARDWYRALVFSDSNDWKYVCQHADEIAGMLGITIDRERYRTMGGQEREKPAIYFSGFWSQGDGASFDGYYAYKPGALAAIKKYVPEDTGLCRIAAELQAAQKQRGYKLVARCKVSGHYSHSGCMAVEVEHRSSYDDVGDAETRAIRDALRAFADWIYSQLQAEYEYQSSDGAIEEAMHANEYEFTEEGKRV